MHVATFLACLKWVLAGVELFSELQKQNDILNWSEVVAAAVVIYRRHNVPGTRSLQLEIGQRGAKRGRGVKGARLKGGRICDGICLEPGSGEFPSAKVLLESSVLRWCCMPVGAGSSRPRGKSKRERVVS